MTLCCACNVERRGGLNTGEVECSLRELTERTRRIALSEDLHRLALASAVCTSVFHCCGFDVSK